MTYRREVEKAIKGYMKSLGYKYNTKRGAFIDKSKTGLAHTVSFAYETHFRAHYYFMRTYVGVASRSLNDILSEVTDGRVNYGDIYLGPVYHSTIKQLKCSDKDYIHCEFIGDRPMEENIADLDRMYNTDVKRLFEAYNTQKSIYTCSAHEEEFLFNPSNSSGISFYGPLGFFFDDQFDKAFEFLDEQIQIEKDTIKACGKNVCPDTIEDLKSYEIYRKNLKKWIDERRQFKVDDEYLPTYKNLKSTPISNGLQKMQSIIGKIIKDK